MSDQTILNQLSALTFSFEPPMPVGPLVGRAATPIEVEYNLLMSVWDFVLACRKAVQDAYDSGRMELDYFKDVQLRLESLDYLDKEVILTPSNLMTICNTLGARSVKSEIASKIKYLRYGKLYLSASTNYACIITLQRALYNVAMWASKTDYMHEEQIVQTYMAKVASDIRYEEWLSSRYPNHADNFEYEKVMSGFIGIYAPEYNYARQDENIYATYASELEDYYSDLDEVPDHEAVASDAQAVRVAVGEHALFDKDSPLALL